ncbi:microfibrillar-associated protein 1-like [Limulus polyphemus]|uniref:Microfibrillar-associated protein 1-like n=1 Tax=Limulus polyphemus TaxID=6850 RepID=A0ABM1BFZ9_LIMPO|nr:microfibrillar-associated protein 1-like [Limulus polyphemus]
MAGASTVGVMIQSTAGAIPIINEKGEVSMQKVKVHRYVSGRRPKYAPEESSEEESEEEFPFERGQQAVVPEPPEVDEEAEKHDPRLRRLQRREQEEDEEERIERHRQIHEPEVIATGDQNEEAGELKEPTIRWRDEEESSDEEELDEEEIERRRILLRQKAKERVEQEEELMDVEDEGRSEVEESEESEYEEYSDSEEETGPRLKPVFVRKKDRVTIQEREREVHKQKELELEVKRMNEDRRRQTLKIIEDENRKEIMGTVKQEDPALTVNTDDENDEAAYESWKLRELKRIKRDKEEREGYEKERLEIERIRIMPEEKRRTELRNMPRVITNKPVKGKYQFLQKYYHRGAFYLNEEEEVLKQDFSAPTLEDHFNKTVLPKVMQVKNFGRSGRTKYTHLVDQDTTHFDSPWISETAQNVKFHTNQAGGMKQMFERPSVKKRKK